MGLFRKILEFVAGIIVGSFLSRVGAVILGPLGALVGFFFGYSLGKRFVANLSGDSTTRNTQSGSGRSSYGGGTYGSGTSGRSSYGGGTYNSGTSGRSSYGSGTYGRGTYGQGEWDGRYSYDRSSYDRYESHRKEYNREGSAPRTSVSPYAVLGVSPTATDEEVKRAYRELAMKYHPDRYAGQDASTQKMAEERFKLINSAYDRIKKERSY